jgi:hypothetical protein
MPNEDRHQCDFRHGVECDEQRVYGPVDQRRSADGQTEQHAHDHGEREPGAGGVERLQGVRPDYVVVFDDGVCDSGRRWEHQAGAAQGHGDDLPENQQRQGGDPRYERVGSGFSEFLHQARASRIFSRISVTISLKPGS